MRVSSTGQGAWRQRFRPGWPGGGSQVGRMRQATLADLWRCQLVWPWVEPTNLSTFKSCLSGARVRAGEGRGGVRGVRWGGDGLNCWCLSSGENGEYINSCKHVDARTYITTPAVFIYADLHNITPLYQAGVRRLSSRRWWYASLTVQGSRTAHLSSDIYSSACDEGDFCKSADLWRDALRFLGCGSLILLAIDSCPNVSFAEKWLSDWWADRSENGLRGTLSNHWLDSQPFMHLSGWFCVLCGVYRLNIKTENLKISIFGLFDLELFIVKLNK